MTIATKIGGLIVKDGKLAENCWCCATWNCYQNCATAICEPCGYTSAMPSTLNASLQLSIQSDVYVPARSTGFGGVPQTTIYKITPANASSASANYTLSRESSTCLYRKNPGVLNEFIRVQVGASGSSRLVLGASNWSCANNCDSGMSLLSLGTWIPCKQSGLTSWDNAASKSYPFDNYAFLPGSGDPSGTGYLLYGFGFVLNSTSQVTPCVANPFSSIYSRYVFDLHYTDVRGSMPVPNTIIPSACTLTVSQ